MDIEVVIRESKAEALQDTLNIATQTGKEQFLRQLRLFTSQEGILRRRQDVILSLRKKELNLDNLFDEVKELEPLLETFFKKTDVEKNSYEQLFFTHPAFQILNTLPFFLIALSYFKLYVVPIMAVMMPVAMIIMPYFYLVYWYNLPISLEEYAKISLSMFGLQDFNLKNPKLLVQATITIFSIAQSIYQPIQNAKHLGKIHVDLEKRGKAVERLAEISSQLLSLFPENQRPQINLLDIGDGHKSFAEVWLVQYKLRLLLQFIGDVEVVYRLAQNTALFPVHFISGDKPCLVIQEGIDPYLPSPIPYSVEFTKHHHAILTGPNRGGKSSVLRSTLLNVVMAQTFGLAFTKKSMSLRPFDWIATGLRLEDKPGSISMFESEVEFATKILQRSKDTTKVGFVLFDELFHSTNPPDGARTASIFLQKLWKQENVGSFISTHVFSLAKKSPVHIQKLCVPAKKDASGELTFTYTLQRGVCEVSSVDLILKEKGLLRKV